MPRLPPDPRLIAWGEAGKKLYPIAAGTMLARNPPEVFPPTPVPPEYRQALEPHFGRFLDNVRFHWDAELLDALEVPPFGRITLTGADAQTFGYDVYFRPGKRELPLVAHELVHVQQFVSRGESLSNFGRDYFRGFFEGKLKYEKNPMEKEAYDFQARYFP